jgi:hypothetical protein
LTLWRQVYNRRTLSVAASIFIRESGKPMTPRCTVAGASHRLGELVSAGTGRCAAPPLGYGSSVRIPR